LRCWQQGQNIGQQEMKKEAPIVINTWFVVYSYSSHIICIVPFVVYSYSSHIICILPYVVNIVDIIIMR
jgi:hypothetical protein